MSEAKNDLSNQGFKIIKGVFPPTEINLLQEEADRLATGEQSACVRHIRKKSNIFDKFATSPALLGLIPENLIPVRSILFNKTPAQNWPVAWHQDLTIAVVEEQSVIGYGPWSHKDGSPHVQPPVKLLQKMITIRVHLDNTPASNGALRVIPKSHLLGKLPSDQISRHCRLPAHTCECNPGDILLMSPLILHSSQRSESPANRRVLHFEYAPSDALPSNLSWFE
ncbi:phytanoyl-CoA dioxygenase family protein [Verrucomicrobiaceae bacterium 227]